MSPSASDRGSRDNNTSFCKGAVWGWGAHAQGSRDPGEDAGRSTRGRHQGTSQLHLQNPFYGKSTLSTLCCVHPDIP